MPTLLVIEGVRIVIYPNDHPPAHVHALGPGARARYALNCPAGPVALMDAEGFRRVALDRLGRGIAEHLRSLCSSWTAIHG